MLSHTIGFIGAGQMATALAQGFVKANLVAGSQLIASDAVDAALTGFVARVAGAKRAASNAETAAGADVLILAVKPQQMPGVLAELGPRVRKTQLIISIAAGVTLDSLVAGLGGHARVVRVMPNTPCLVGLSASAYSAAKDAGDVDRQLVEQLLAAVGRVFRVEEKLLDAVTGLSGSGPAFVYLVIEALSDGGVRMGLPRDVATALAAQTVKGAAEMVLSSAEHPAVLKERVTSPGGTTIAGLQVLENGATRAAMMAAVEAATRRAAELGKATK